MPTYPSQLRHDKILSGNCHRKDHKHQVQLARHRLLSALLPATASSASCRPRPCGRSTRASPNPHRRNRGAAAHPRPLRWGAQYSAHMARRCSSRLWVRATALAAALLPCRCSAIMQTSSLREMGRRGAGSPQLVGRAGAPSGGRTLRRAASEGPRCPAGVPTQQAGRKTAPAGCVSTSTPAATSASTESAQPPSVVKPPGSLCSVVLG